jgi:hypothetical protein
MAKARKKSKAVQMKKERPASEGSARQAKSEWTAAKSWGQYTNPFAANPFGAKNPFGANPFSANFSEMFSGGRKALENGFGPGMEEAKKVHEKMLEMGSENIEKFAKHADSAAKNLGDAVEFGKENFEALVESANIASKIAKNIAAEISEYTNNVATDNFKAFEDFLSCKTVSDFLNLNSTLLKNNVDACFNESLRLSELFVELGKAAEPVSQQVAAAAERLTKSMAA